MGFYSEYFNYDGEEATAYKEQYVQSLLVDGLLYKFVSFTEDDTLNDIKFRCLKKDTVWASHYKYFEDSTELKIPLNEHEVSRKTRRTVHNIKFLIDTLREIYDVCCFTNRIDEYMWEYYANNSMGICLCFRIDDYDKYFPIEYIEKKNLDLTRSAIKSINDNAVGRGFNSIESKEVAMLPLVLKDKNYKEESEIRLLSSSFDDANGMLGEVVRPNIKDEYSYRGTELCYSDIDLRLVKVIIGKKCRTEHVTRVCEIMQEKNIDLERG